MPAIGCKGVCRGMGAVERIFPGHLYLVPDFLRLIVRASVPDGSGNEIRLQRGHQVGFLLSYGLAQEVGLPEVESPSVWATDMNCSW